ncbi:hypothetical protein [Sulfobacillus sp. hq2]|uniref:Uncharacterized protein n=1 Tax=Sulfobacillus thermotolerans TaxID=338644 RepID=A0ABM6RQA2_9FIRM|nr:hypothetical protein [Sulfobacillus sp. hq2]AUW93502.1 hypothetical protein BXT84_05710 [Sulfobacillus thermotolerans]POB10743.1 hypothetical protein CO251_07960 [Sulfobacillus sp. hq2]
MVESIGILTHNQDMDEILRRVLAPYRIVCVNDLRGLLALKDPEGTGRVIVDWLQCSAPERQMLRRWEQNHQVVLIDISGSLLPNKRRIVFMPPFSWKGFIRALTATDQRWKRQRATP